VTGISGGNIIKTISLNAPSSINPGNIGISISSTDNLGITMIKRGHMQQISAGGGLSINRYYDIAPTNNTSLNATLQMYYFDSELAGINKSELNFFESKDNGSTWSFIGQDNNDQVNDWVSKNNIAQLYRLSLASNITNPLPLKLISFSANLVNRQAQLQWVTAEEVNSSYFDVLRSHDEAAFSKLLSIPAQSNSTREHTYNAVDGNPFNGINYYRLKEVDIDGNPTLSPIVNVILNDGSLCAVFPNPTSGIVNLNISVIASQQASIGLYDTKGKLIEERDVQLSAGSNLLKWDISRQAKGVYFLKSANISIPLMKVVKQ
jgi:hypothetical protein